MHLDDESCLEVTVLKGQGSEVQRFANHVIAERGVRHGHVVYIPAGEKHGHSHDTQPFARPSAHGQRPQSAYANRVGGC